jgi:glutamate synthase (NADPH/NADH) small chain
MFTILQKKEIAPHTFWFEVEAPLVCHSRKAGQFMVICPHPKAERIPISLAGSNPARDSIHFVVHAIGQTTKEIAAMEPGEAFLSILGPLGMHSPIKHYGTVVCIGGGYGVAASLPIADELRQAGNHVIGMIGARSRNLILLKDEMRSICNELRLCTNDGSAGMQGLVTEALDAILAEGIQVDHVFAIGPVPMMRALSDQTKKLGIPCTVSLNPIMVDGTGMCGACRVKVGGETKFCCYHGPDFDGHQVDFEDLMSRLNWYADESKIVQAQEDEDDHAPVCPHHSTVQELEAHWLPEVPDGIALNDAALKMRDRLRIPRQTMPHQKPEDRIKNFKEVALGFNEQQAIAESQRCISCGKPVCIEGCPVGIDIPAFIAKIQHGEFLEAASIIEETNVLGSICGRVCPQENQCEAVCTIGKKGQPVAIGRLERFAADYARHYGKHEAPPKPVPTGKKVAVIGSGPAGLTVAGDLVRQGHEVHVLEALHKLGGVLTYGIPEFRLPNEIVEFEIEKLRQLGVLFKTDFLVVKTRTIDQLLQEDGYDAIFIGTGAGLPKMMNIPGEELKGVYTANEFLTRINLMRADLKDYNTPVTVGNYVRVIGAGNTAMDAARVARRMGARHVSIVYRRTEKECPARLEELEHAKEEGIAFEFLTAPVRLIGDEKGWVKEMECLRMELGEPDDSGRCRPVAVEGSAFRLPADTIVTALGFGINPLVPSTTPGLKVGKWDVIYVDKATGQTTREGVFAGGDSITGGSTVISAMGQGRIAANSIHRYLQGNL